METYKRNQPAPVFNYNSIENYVLAYYKIDKKDLNAFSRFYSSMFDDMEDLIDLVRIVIDNHTYTQVERSHISANISCFQHYMNSFYYGYMGSMSLLPTSARKAHFEMAKNWKTFPNGTPLDLAQEEYEQFMSQELTRCDEEYSKVNSLFDHENQQLEELEKRLDDLEKQAEMY